MYRLMLVNDWKKKDRSIHYTIIKNQVILLFTQNALQSSLQALKKGFFKHFNKN